MTFAKVCLCGVAAMLVVLLGGCDDPEARERAGAASREINDLKVKLDEAKKINESTQLSIKAVEERLSKQIDKRVDDITQEIRKNQEKLLQQLSQDVEKSRKDAMSLADSSRNDVNKELTVTKGLVAEDMQKMRAELKAATDELRKFMDNQLKELYPYAYQPRRLDANTPPSVNESK